MSRHQNTPRILSHMPPKKPSPKRINSFFNLFYIIH